MKDGKPSFTAIGVAIDRAAHQVLDDDPKILRDPIALPIVEGLVRENFAMRWPQRYATASTTVSMRQRSCETPCGRSSVRIPWCAAALPRTALWRHWLAAYGSTSS